MEITIIDNYIVCTQDEPNGIFWSSVAGKCFSPKPEEDYNIAYVKPITYNYENDLIMLKADRRILFCIIYYATHCLVNIDQRVKDRYDEMAALEVKLNTIQKEKEETNNKIKYWNFLCNHGCKNCANLAYYIDTPYCKACNDKLREENRPNYDNNGVYQLFSNLVI